MNHANLKQIMISTQRSGGRLMHIREHIGTNNLHMYVYSGVTIISRPNGSWHLDIDARQLSQPAIDLLNLLVPDPSFRIKKVKPRTFKFGDEDFLGEKTEFEFDAKGNWTTTKGLVIAKNLEAETKELHKLTRRLRKKVQPQLRLLGPEKFKIDRVNQHTFRRNNSEVDCLIDLLDGKDVVDNLARLMYVCDMTHLFGQGSRWSTNRTSEFQPKKIIDKILRRVQANKLAILEKYDERRKTTDRSKTSTRRAA